MSEPSAEVIEAVAKALAFTQHDQTVGDGLAAEEVWSQTREKNRDIQRDRARAALNAAGAAVERDSGEVAALHFVRDQVQNFGADTPLGRTILRRIMPVLTGADWLPTETPEREPTDESRTSGAALPKGLDEAWQTDLDRYPAQSAAEQAWRRTAFGAGFVAGAAWRDAPETARG